MTPEEGTKAPEMLKDESEIVQNDLNIISFEGPNDPDNLIDWSRTYKWYIFILIPVMTLVITFATLICAPTAPLILAELAPTDTSFLTLVVSIWELGEAFRSLLTGPLSEIYGRGPVYHAANVLFVLFSIGGALSTSIRMVLAFRFLAGFTVASVTLNPTIVGDLFIVEERGKAMAIMNLAPLLGPLAGPVVGGYFSQAIVFRETYKVKIIQRKVAKLRQKGDNDQLQSWYDTPLAGNDFWKALVRPAQMLILSPILLSLALYVSVVMGYLYLLLTSMTEAFEVAYGFTTGSASLTFLGLGNYHSMPSSSNLCIHQADRFLGIGMTIGMIVCRVVLDHYVKRWRGSNGTKPEYRLPALVMRGLVMPAGLFFYSWTNQTRVHWIVPTLALVPLGFGFAVIFLPAFSYMVDAFGIHAASALAASITLRCVTGGVFPLAGPPLYTKFGQGWGNSILGFIALGFLPVPLLLMRYGERMRRRSKLLVTH
ncbi:hypothetical protein ACLMJK_006845 [Lecanora helva]